jgi:hypothetical protein
MTGFSSWREEKNLPMNNGQFLSRLFRPPYDEQMDVAGQWSTAIELCLTAFYGCCVPALPGLIYLTASHLAVHVSDVSPDGSRLASCGRYSKHWRDIWNKQEKSIYPNALSTALS